MQTLARIRNPKDGKDAVIDEEKLAAAFVKYIKDKQLIAPGDIKGLTEEMASYRQQMAWKQAGQHGAGDTIVAGTNIQIVTLPDGTKRISAIGAGTGSVTDVSVITANGFAGTVANSTTTPEINSLQLNISNLKTATLSTSKVSSFFNSG